mmetsp:Transcript_18056/g.38924  ORF Transcript_18056/g.38924 Transcript_18056/m.38924 type:complete len:300 (-) Transcript_18056:6-905(-)
MGEPEKEKINLDEYTLPKIWTDDGQNGGKFAGINKSTSGARHDKELPKGKHPLQLYSLGTPNGQKVTILLEELLARGYEGAEYDAWIISLGGDQFGSGFVEINPNSKIPALIDTTTNTRMFESGSIMIQLSEKFDNAFLPANFRSEVLNWLFWQMGSAPFVGGGFGHFYNYAPYKMKYPIDRYAMETKRQLDVLERQLTKQSSEAGEGKDFYLVGDEYTLADIAIFPWYGHLVLGNQYKDADIFLNVKEEYPTVIKWAEGIMARPAVDRGCRVNKSWGAEGENLKERHDASDFDGLAKL